MKKVLVADVTMPMLSRIRDLNDHAAALLDASDLEAWSALFVESAKYQVIARENVDQGLSHATIYCNGAAMIRDRVSAIRNAMVYQERYSRHFISGCRILSMTESSVHSQSNFMIVLSMMDARPEIVMIGRYVDLIVEQDGKLLFKERRCEFDNHWTPETLIMPV